jgi:hypothetical protein
VLLGVGVAVFAAGMFLLFFSQAPPPGTELSELLRMRAPEQYTLSFGHIFDLTPQALGKFRGPLLGVSIAFLLGSVVNWFLRRRGSPSRGNAALAGMMVVVLLCVHSALITFSPILSSKNLATAIAQHWRAGDVVVIDDEYEQGSTLNFYLGVPVRILHVPSANLYYGSLFPDAPHVFETQPSFDQLWHSPTVVFLWTQNDNPQELDGANYYVVAQSGGKRILTNHPIAR